MKQEAPLPLPHRLAIAYLVLPVLVWLLGWLEWWFGIPLAALTAAGAWRLLGGPWQPTRPRRTTGVLLLIALVWVMLSPAGGYFGWTVTDWITHLLFSGLDALEFLLHYGLRDGVLNLAAQFAGGSLEWNYVWGPSRLAYLSIMECLLWGPQHFTVAGLGALLIVQLSRQPRFLEAGGVVLVWQGQYAYTHCPAASAGQ